MKYSDARDSRFSDWNSTCGYYEKDFKLSGNAVTTDSKRNLVDTGKYLTKSMEINSCQYKQNKSQVVKVDKAGVMYRAPSKTTFSTNYIDPKSWKDILLQKYDESLWLDAFNGYVREYKKNPTSRDTSILEDAFIRQDDVTNVVTSCLGSDVPSFLVDKFVKLCGQVAIERRISWSNFV